MRNDTHVDRPKRRVHDGKSYSIIWFSRNANGRRGGTLRRALLESHYDNKAGAVQVVSHNYNTDLRFIDESGQRAV